jgi:PAS domain S-box-containing protein
VADAPSPPGKTIPVRVLNVEDVPGDSILIERELGRRLGPVALTRVDTPEGFAAALREQRWDVIIADHRLPRFSSLAALAMLRGSGLDIPVIVVSGTMGIEFAVEAMRAGARDYLVKDELVRLASVVEREVQDAAARRQVAARHLLRLEVLEALLAPGELEPQLRRVLELLRLHAGADAAAIRLRSKGDFPYAAQVGFDADFLESEDSLCVPGQPGHGDHPEAGGLDLACLCGAVLLQRRKLPWPLTDRGSFVTGSAGQAFDEASALPHLRARCVQGGFASLALLPLRSSQEMVGLLQLNARAPDRFDGPLVQFLEEICGSIGLAIERREAEAAMRASEERYRVLVETSPNGVAMTALDGTIIQANRRLAELFGVTSAAALEGQRLVDLVADEDRSRAVADLAGFVGRGRPGESQLRFRHGAAAFDGEVTASLSGGADAAPVATLVVIIRDVTEQRRLQARLAQADRMTSVGMLAAGVVHEINNPLTFVLSNLESLSSDLPAIEAATPPAAGKLDLSDRAREALDGARRIREIVRDLRTFSRSSDGRLEPVSLNKVIEGAIHMTHGEVKYRARLTADLGTLPPVRANEGRLAQVFLNLLVNAAQAIPEGDAEHNQILVRTWAEAGTVLAEVRDTGAGIPAEILPRIFDPFFTTKPASIGTGLGLAITRGIVEEAGGRISVESRTGEGARFLVQLPADRSGPDASAPSLAVPPAATLTRRGRILVVDDEPLIRSSLVRLLRAEHDIVEAASGAAADAILASDQRFDVILCDLIMPEMSGMDLHARLASTRPHLVDRMVFMSGGAFTERAAEFLHGAAIRLLEKPIEVARLRELVRGLVAARAP